MVQSSDAGNVILRDVHYLPALPNLLSYGTLVNRGWYSSITSNGGHIGIGGSDGPRYSLSRAGSQSALRTVCFKLLTKSDQVASEEELT